MSARALVPIVEQHAEEAAFLWLLRDRAVDAPHYAPRHLARLEERIEAHRDGLKVAGETGFEIAMAQLDRTLGPGEMFAAAALALEAGAAAPLAPIVEIADAVPAARRGLLGAIGWTPPTVLAPLVRAWLGAPAASLRLLGVVACSLHRADPGARMADRLADPDPGVRARAYRLAGELGRIDLRETAARAIEREDGPARDWAAWAAALLGDPLALAELEPIAEANGPVAGPALEALVRAAPPARVAAWIRRLNGDPGQRRLVAQALGGLGDPAGVPWLLARMREPELARAAGEGFSLITGVDLADEKLEGQALGDFEAGPNDDPSGAAVAPDPDEDLPWPDPDLVQAWWQGNAGRFARGVRHLLGRAVDVEACEAAGRRGFQRQRRAGSFELALLRPGTRLGNWRKRVAMRQDG